MSTMYFKAKTRQSFIQSCNKKMFLESNAQMAYNSIRTKGKNINKVGEPQEAQHFFTFKFFKSEPLTQAK